MAIEITDEGATIKIINGSKIDYANKTGMNVTVNGDYVFIEEADGESHKFLYSDVTTPSSASAEALASTIEGYIETASESVRVSSANTPSIASDATAVSANSTRKSITIQNLGTNALYVRFGSGATTSVFHVALKAGTANDDGTGGSVYNNEYTGVVTIAGTSPRYTVLEL